MRRNEKYYASPWWYRIWFKEIKQTVVCPICGEATSYTNHFVPRFFGNGDTRLSPIKKWSVNCHHCKNDIYFTVKTYPKIVSEKK